jgi:hypothetical protein
MWPDNASLRSFSAQIDSRSMDRIEVEVHRADQYFLVERYREMDRHPPIETYRVHCQNRQSI